MTAIRKAGTTLGDNPIDLVGPKLEVGQAAPDFALLAADFSEVSLASSAGKTRIILSVPSLDTGICAASTKRFNEEVAALENTEVIVVSMDLPFGQKRWCGAESVDAVTCLSDHASGTFGAAYGTLITGGAWDRILARALFVVGPDNTLKHVEYSPTIGMHPDYDAALAAAKS